MSSYKSTRKQTQAEKAAQNKKAQVTKQKNRDAKADAERAKNKAYFLIGWWQNKLKQGEEKPSRRIGSAVLPGAPARKRRRRNSSPFRLERYRGRRGSMLHAGQYMPLL